MPSDYDDELERYFKHAAEEMFPKLKGSALSITLLHGDPDPKLCLELGAAILFDKPLILVAPEGYVIPPTLARIASATIVGDPFTDETMRGRLNDAITHVIDTDERAKRPL